MLPTLTQRKRIPNCYDASCLDGITADSLNTYLLAVKPDILAFPTLNQMQHIANQLNLSAIYRFSNWPIHGAVSAIGYSPRSDRM